MRQAECYGFPLARRRGRKVAPRTGEEARRRGDRKISVLGLMIRPAPAEAIGSDLETARDALEALDRSALASIGIDAELDAPPIPLRERGKRPVRPTLKAVLHDRRSA